MDTIQMISEAASDNSGETQNRCESRTDRTSLSWQDVHSDEIWVGANQCSPRSDQATLPEQLDFTPLDWGDYGPFFSQQSQEIEASSQSISDNSAVAVVQPGDCLYNIAKQYLGDPNRWPEIYALNKSIIGANPDLIHPGMRLQMPSDAKSLSQSIGLGGGGGGGYGDVSAYAGDGTTGAGSGGDGAYANNAQESDEGGPEVYLNQNAPRVNQIMDFLVEKGLSPQQAAGIAGNFQYESGLNPAIEEIGNGIGYGIAQWSFGRREKLNQFAADQGMPVSDLRLQLKFLWLELQTTENATLRAFDANPSMSAQQASNLFYDLFERPRYNAQNKYDRSMTAEQFAGQFGSGGDSGAFVADASLSETSQSVDYNSISSQSPYNGSGAVDLAPIGNPQATRLKNAGYGGQCTYWAALHHATPWASPDGPVGNADQWYDLAKQAGVEVTDNNNPVPGAIVCFNYQHVGIVKSVNADGSFVVSEMNVQGFDPNSTWGSGIVSERTFRPGDSTIKGFIV